MTEDPDSEILIEKNRIGQSMEVRAISAGDGLEVVFTAPVSAMTSDIERLARAKLAYVRRKLSGEPDSSPDAPQRPDGKGGWVA